MLYACAVGKVFQILSRLQKMQADAYATTDRNIKNGQNPLAYLDNTNFDARQHVIWKSQ